jgi:hypothetical protein
VEASLGYRPSLIAPVLGACLFIGCAPQGREATPSDRASAASVLRLGEDPTLYGARVFPEVLDPGQSLGEGASAGLRFLEGGIRLLELPAGGLRASDERFPDLTRGGVVNPGSLEVPSFVVPTRLGGGFLFVAQPTLYRADTWLSPPRPIYTSPSEIGDVVLGLDRVYVRNGDSGSEVAVDPRTGRLMDAGPWPVGPSVTAYRALDGWIAAAIVDLRGVIATFDAGATWKPLHLPIHPKSVSIARIDPKTGELVLVSPSASASGDFIVIRGADSRYTEACFALNADETTTKLPSCPGGDSPADANLGSKDSAAGKVFGRRPLLTAVEDGWPLDGESALVARDGALGRVRLSDGAWTLVNLDAFPSKPARCHPMPILVDEGAPGLGFACAEPRGKLALYLYDPQRFALTGVRSFEHARPFLSYANGAIAVRGVCGEGAASSAYCVWSRPPEGKRTPRWTEARLALPSASPSDAGSKDLASAEDPRRLLVWGNGRIGLLSPPSAKGDSGRLAFLGEAAEKTVKLEFPELTPEASQALKGGVWLDGFEERRPGVASGWVEAAGAMLGIEIEESGRVRVGEYVRDAGSPIVSGRYGLGWGPAHRGYETTDGGMTWVNVDVPRPLSPPPEARACGPIGCTAMGWIRVGWGKSKATALERLEPVHLLYHPPRDLDLACEPTTPIAASSEADFYGAPPPARRAEDVKLSVDAFSLDSPDRGRGAPLARIYAWGPQAEDWAHIGRWTIRWLSPYASSRDVRSTALALAPFASSDSARRALGQLGGSSSWLMAVGDDPSSALLLARKPGPDVMVLAVDSDRSPAEVRRADGERFSAVDSAIRVGGKWYLATPQAYGDAPATIIFRVDGSEAHEFAQIPRASFDSRTPGLNSTVRLARRSDGRALGLVVDGQPPPDRAIPLRWVLPIDVETGALAEPERLGAADLADRGKLSPCVEDDTGWILDTPWPVKARLDKGPEGPPGVLTKLYMRVRLSPQRACLEELSGVFEPDPPVARGLVPPPAVQSGRAPLVWVSAFDNGRRSLLRCRSK